MAKTNETYELYGAKKEVANNSIRQCEYRINTLIINRIIGIRQGGHSLAIALSCFGNISLSALDPNRFWCQVPALCFGPG